MDVGFVCTTICKRRCLPSCKFQCCESQYVSTQGDQTDSAGFDFSKLLESLKETQTEYHKLKKYIHKINSTVGDDENDDNIATFIDKNKNKINELKSLKKPPKQQGVFTVKTKAPKKKKEKRKILQQKC